MKIFFHHLGLCLVAICIYLCVPAQKISNDSLTLKKRIYKVSVLSADSKPSTGYLAGLSDSNLYISPSPLHFSSVITNEYFSSYPYYHLEKIEIKRKGAVGRAAWKGALAGLVTGAIIGFSLGDDPKAPPDNPNDPFGNLLNGLTYSLRFTAGQKAATGAIVGVLTGGAIGALVGGLLKKKFIIGRNKEKFRAMRENILEKLYVKYPYETHSK